MNLQTLMSDLREKKKIVDTPVEPGPTAGFRLAEQRKAKEALENYFDQYRLELMAATSFFIMVGDAAQSAAELSKNKFDTYSYSAEQLISDLAAKVEPSVYMNRSFGTELRSILSNLIDQRAKEIGIVTWPELGNEQMNNNSMASRADLEAQIKELFLNHIGTEFLAVNALHQAAQACLSDDFAGTTLPLVLHTNDAAFAERLTKDLGTLTANVSMINVEDDSEKTVKAALLGARKTQKHKEKKDVV